MIKYIDLWSLFLLNIVNFFYYFTVQIYGIKEKYFLGKKGFVINKSFIEEEQLEEIKKEWGVSTKDEEQALRDLYTDVGDVEFNLEE